MKITEHVCSTEKVNIWHSNTEVPGVYCLTFPPDSSTIEEVASWIWLIRKKLSKSFDCIVGVYYEKLPSVGMSMVILPFHVKALLEMNIPFEPYQPYIEYYLEQYRISQEEKEILGRIDWELKKYSDEIDCFSIAVPKCKMHFSSSEDVAEEILPIIELESILDEPKAPEGKKSFSCIGGSKNYLCFFADSSLSRASFMRRYQKSIPDFLHSVICEDEIEFHQDAKYAIPGFIILAPLEEYRTIDIMPIERYKACLKKAFKLREILLTYRDVEEVFIYYDEHVKKPSSVHIWVLPVYKDKITVNECPSMLNHTVWNYMDRFAFREEEMRIMKVLTELKRQML